MMTVIAAFSEWLSRSTIDHNHCNGDVVGFWLVLAAAVWGAAWLAWASYLLRRKNEEEELEPEPEIPPVQELGEDARPAQYRPNLTTVLQ